MSVQLIFAVTTITSALIFYTIGVWGERKAKVLKKKHLITFYLGLYCDTLGTYTMSRIADVKTVVERSVIIQNIHGITGTLAIVLMLFHALWATWVLYKNNERMKRLFHKFSITVWTIWLIPYLVGMVIGMRG